MKPLVIGGTLSKGEVANHRHDSCDKTNVEMYLNAVRSQVKEKKEEETPERRKRHGGKGGAKGSILPCRVAIRSGGRTGGQGLQKIVGPWTELVYFLAADPFPPPGLSRKRTAGDSGGKSRTRGDVPRRNLRTRG